MIKLPKNKLSLLAYREIWQLLRQRPILITSLGVTSLFIVFSEGIGVGVILPFLDASAAGASSWTKTPALIPIYSMLTNLTPVQKVRFAALALIIVTFVRGVFMYLCHLFSALLATRIEQEIQKQVFAQLHKVELRFIHRERLGDLLAILDHHTYQVGRLLLSVSRAIPNLFTVIVYATFMIFISWQLTLAVVVLLFSIMFFIEGQFSTRIKQAGADTQKNRRQIKSVSVESLSAMKLIRLYSRQAQSMRRFEAILQTYHNYLYRAEKLVALNKPLFSLLNAVALGLLLLIGTFLLPQQTEIWLEQMILFLAITFRLMRPATSLVQTQAQIAQKYPALRSVLDFLDQKDKPYLQNGHLKFTTLNKGITLDAVSFRYEVHENDVIDTVSFEIPKGKMTAIVGASGAGKSTLIYLLARLYDCQKGIIAIDGMDVRDLDIASWRSRIAIVSQDTFIFNDTVWANLKLAKENATPGEMQQAARSAQAHDFIMTLPQGYDTQLGDRGARLSGGQQQRIAIARAILADAQLLIFDEATSDLDSKTERAIQEAIKVHSRGRTTLVIAHRLSTIRHADNIVVLDRGRVVEQGTHQELAHQKGHYWQLIQAQNLHIAPEHIGNAVLESTQEMEAISPNLSRISTLGRIEIQQ